MAKVGFDLYTTEVEAIVRAAELGCESSDGNFHTLVIEGTTYYMPCKSADSYNEKQQFTDLEIEDCSDCCNCTPSQLTLVKMWNCTYLKLVESFIRSSEYGDSCLEDTIEKFVTGVPFVVFLKIGSFTRLPAINTLLTSGILNCTIATLSTKISKRY